MITVDGKELRNLQEQVKKNKEDIANHYNVDRVLADLGIRLVGTITSASDLPDPLNYGGKFGDGYAVGTAAPYDIYIYTRPDIDAGHPNNYWLNIGSIAIVGPEGPEGPEGPKGDKGDATKIYTRAFAPNDFSGNDGDIWITYTTTPTAKAWSYYVKEAGTWKFYGSLKGEQGNPGIPGPQGEPGPVGPRGPKGDTGDVGGFINIAGTVPNYEALPHPAELHDLTKAYLVGAEKPYELYIQVGSSSDKAYWKNMGPLNVATYVTVNGAFQNTWDADTKADVTALEETNTKVSANTGNIVNNTNNINALDSRVTAAEDDIVTINEDRTQLHADIDANRFVMTNQQTLTPEQQAQVKTNLAITDTPAIPDNVAVNETVELNNIPWDTITTPAQFGDYIMKIVQPAHPKCRRFRIHYSGALNLTYRLNYEFSQVIGLPDGLKALGSTDRERVIYEIYIETPTATEYKDSDPAILKFNLTVFRDADKDNSFYYKQMHGNNFNGTPYWQNGEWIQQKSLKIVPNPAETPVATLATLGINGVNYAIPGGGGGIPLASDTEIGGFKLDIGSYKQVDLKYPEFNTEGTTLKQILYIRDPHGGQTGHRIEVLASLRGDTDFGIGGTVTKQKRIEFNIYNGKTDPYQGMGEFTPVTADSVTKYALSTLLRAGDAPDYEYNSMSLLKSMENICTIDRQPAEAIKAPAVISKYAEMKSYSVDQLSAEEKQRQGIPENALPLSATHQRYYEILSYNKKYILAGPLSKGRWYVDGGPSGEFTPPAKDYYYEAAIINDYMFRSIAK